MIKPDILLAVQDWWKRLLELLSELMNGMKSLGSAPEIYYRSSCQSVSSFLSVHCSYWFGCCCSPGSWSPRISGARESRRGLGETVRGTQPKAGHFYLHPWSILKHHFTHTLHDWEYSDCPSLPWYSGFLFELEITTTFFYDISIFLLFVE